MKTLLSFMRKLGNLNSRSWKYPQRRVVGVWSLHLINLACAFHLFPQYVGRFAHMDGVSMLPTMAEEGEVAIESILTYRLWPNSLVRGDLVTLASPLDPSRIICKRVVGLPGDIICVDPTGTKAPSTEHVVVPKGHVWLVGDNATYARDSRDYGPVSMGLIQGKLVARIWPFNKIGVLHNPISSLD